MRYIIVFLLLLLSACATDDAALTVEQELAALGEIDYNFHVKPILSQNCYACHGPDEQSREADLRLDVRADALTPLDSLPAITPGEPSKSVLFLRIASTDPEERMPPPEAHKTLTPLQIGILERWIEQGAAYKPHWAFVPPVRPDLPEKTDWTQNDIDRFILAGMQRNKMKPSREADKRSLIRRLSFDLTGLPPTLEEVKAFSNDEAPDAYEKMVDRLMASPHFGERMAVHWMDLARYADTNGYSIDGGRHMWLWRDWVIHAFNQNMPFDAFATEQLAGDLLPEPTEAQLIATGFNRNHMITHEGGTIPEENLTNYVADRVKTTSEVFMGLTMACAQCHDHKFDPISQRDYFQFFAYFNTLDDKGLDGDRGINARPSIEAKTPLLSEAEIAALQEEVAGLRAALEKEHPEQPAWEMRQRVQLEQRGKNLALHEGQPLKITTPNRGNTGQILADGSLLIEEAGWLAAYNVSIQFDSEQVGKPITGLRIAFYPDEVAQGKIGHGQREGLEGSFVLTSLNVSYGDLPSDQVDLYRLASLKEITASSSNPAFPTQDIFDERISNGWSPDTDAGMPQHLTLTFAEPLDLRATPYLTAMLVFGQGDNLIPGRFKILAMTGVDDGSNLPADIQDMLPIAASARTAEQVERMREYFADASDVTAPIRVRIRNLEERIKALSLPQPTLVMNVADEPRTTYILNRGQYDQPLEAVQPNAPSALPPLPEDAEANRLGLARWLTSPDHPLMARVTVNRFWQMLFGQGIVSTAADFGSQGALPSHPELLDWLAVEFIDSGWDVKGLLKQMVMSATYRQQSNASERALLHDPENRWLARGPRFRLQAEFIRDAALLTGGLMVDRLGGPSVNPYQPAGLWKEVSHYGSTPATAQVFVQDHGESLYRRSLYTYWKRTAPPPSMLTFDAPNREVCTITRESTNTPLQALVLLNDPQFVEASRGLSARVLNEKDLEDEDRLQLAFETVLSRSPNRKEMQILKKRLADERTYYADAPDKAVAYLSVGESPRNPALDTVEHAAWTAVASMIMNLSEAVTRG